MLSFADKVMSYASDQVKGRVYPNSDGKLKFFGGGLRHKFRPSFNHCQKIGGYFSLIFLFFTRFYECVFKICMRYYGNGHGIFLNFNSFLV